MYTQVLRDIVVDTCDHYVHVHARGIARILTIGGQDRKIAREVRKKILNTGHTH